MTWPRKPTMWLDEKRLMVSVPFTWNLPELKAFLNQRSAAWDTALVGGPAIQLMPDYLNGMDWVTVSTGSLPGVLQRVNSMATRTTMGCVRSCRFCGIGTGKIEQGGFVELDDWPDLPIICDNNLLAASSKHFDRVMDRLEKHVGVDFNQGLDTRILDLHHAERIKGLKHPSIRLAFDKLSDIEHFDYSIWCLLRERLPKQFISSYALVGFDSGPEEAWNRCQKIESYGIKAYPMWFHELDALEVNTVTPKQAEMGWNDYERRRIMQWFYQHKRAVK